MVALVVVAVSVPVLVAYARHDQAARTPGGQAAPTGTPATSASATTAPRTPAAPAPSAPATTGAPPAAAPVPDSGSGQVRVARFTRRSPLREGRTVRVRVEVEKELAFDADDAARQAADTLQDRRSWAGKGAGSHFDFVGEGDSDLTILVATPATVDRRCLPLETLGQVSCQNGRSVNINARRWADAVPDYRGDVALYRQYVVNHEVGHFLGRGHVECPGRGQLAPVMQQQTKGLDGCRANPWP